MTQTREGLTANMVHATEWSAQPDSIWCISIKGRYLGKCEGIQTDILAACGPYVTVQGNHIDIWAIVK